MNIVNGATQTQVLNIPLIIRGQIIEDNMIDFGGRRAGLTIRSPDVNKYYDKIVLRKPADCRDLYALDLNDILDYLEKLGSLLSLSINRHLQRAFDASVAVSGQTPEILRGMYEEAPGNLKRARVKELLDAAFFEPYTEQWVSHTRSDRVIKVRAFGSRMVHINAGNGVGAAVLSLLFNSLLRSDSIVKSPSNDPYTATAIALTMIEMAPDHPLTKHFSVCYWKGGNEEFERRLYRPANIEKIVAWGGQASMTHIRRYTGPGIDLVALDPKTSGSLIGAEVFKSDDTMRFVASLLARDIGAMNQEGCVCARIVHVESGTSEQSIDRLKRFGTMVYEELQLLPSTLSSNNHPSFNIELRHEIEAIRNSEYHTVIGCNANEGGIIVSHENEPIEFADLLTGRVANLIPVDRIEDAYDAITIDTQTIGIYPDALIDKVRDECAWRGGQRLTPLGNSYTYSFAQPHDGIEPLRRMARWVVIEDFKK